MTTSMKHSGGANTRIILLPCFGLIIHLAEDGKGGSIHSDLHEPSQENAEAGRDEDLADERYEAAIDSLESLILAHAVAGLDVSSPAYVEGIKTAVEAIGNNL